MRRVLMLVTAALSLAACEEGVVPAAPPGHKAPVVAPPSTPLESADVSPESEPAEEPRPAPPLPPPAASTSLSLVSDGSRSVSAVNAVVLDLSVSGVRGQGSVDVEFIAPGDLPYEKQSRAVRAPPGETQTLRFSLPVAGTHIASSRMSGAWEARFFLDGEPLASATFTLEP
ncbi:hypothetical protein P2318_16885 [Myxococcaceae bacterium GXIMD 01537]